MPPFDAFIGREHANKDTDRFQLIQRARGIGGERWRGMGTIWPSGVLRGKRSEDEVG